MIQVTTESVFKSSYRSLACRHTLAEWEAILSNDAIAQESTEIYQQAIAEHFRGNYRSALKLYRKALRVCRADPATNLALAVLYSTCEVRWYRSMSRCYWHWKVGSFFTTMNTWYPRLVWCMYLLCCSGSSQSLWRGEHIVSERWNDTTQCCNDMLDVIESEVSHGTLYGTLSNDVVDNVHATVAEIRECCWARRPLRRFYRSKVSDTRVLNGVSLR